MRSRTHREHKRSTDFYGLFTFSICLSNTRPTLNNSMCTVIIVYSTPVEQGPKPSS